MQTPGDSHYRGDKSDVEVTQKTSQKGSGIESWWRTDIIRQSAEQNKKVSLEISLVPQRVFIVDLNG